MSRRLALALGAAVLGAAALASIPARAVDFPRGPAAMPNAEGRTGAVMSIPLNKSQTLRLDRAISKAVIGSSEIADVMPSSISSVYVLGKKIGTTNLTLYDRHGDTVAIVDVNVGPDAQGLKHQLADLLPNEHVGVTIANDALLIDGAVSSPAAAERIASIAETYAPKKIVNLLSVGEPQQVLLEVRFSEMTRGTVKQLGVSQLNFFNNTFGNNRFFGNYPTPYGPNPGPSGNGSVPAIDTKSNPYHIVANILGAGVQVQIDALEQQGLVHTLAQPNLVALSGESASFLAGGEFPVPTGVDNLGRIAIEFKQFGVALAFVPTVLEDGLINLAIAPEVSSLDPAAGIQIAGIQIPGLKVRRAKTQVELRDGQSFAIAGLIQNDFNDTVKAIPLLGRIPIIGALFRSTLFNRNETELVIMVTPHIVRPVRPGQVQLPTDRIQQPSDTDLLLLGKTERHGTLHSPVGLKPGGIDGEYGHIVR